jgi:hypothetical protein
MLRLFILSAVSLGCACLQLVPGQAAAQSAPHGHSIDGVWQAISADTVFTGRVIDGHPEPMAPMDGGPIPFQPWNAALHAGWRSDLGSNNGQRCLPDGTVKTLRGFDPIRFIEADGQITVLFEFNNLVDIFRFSDQHDAGLKPSWSGDAIARWEGDTLLVDVVGFNGKVPLPHAVYTTTLLHVIHRFQLLSGGKQLQDRITIDDPGAFLHSFDIQMTFDRLPDSTKLRDYQCAEANEDLPERIPFWPVDWGRG